MQCAAAAAVGYARIKLLMKRALKLISSSIALALLCGASGVLAMSLGKVRGFAHLGKPLELSIPVQFDSEEAATGFCFDADLFYGDLRVQNSHITLAIQPEQSQGDAAVKVVSRANINEPVVTVYLRAGCLHKTSRKYVLLADLVSEVGEPELSHAPLVRSNVVRNAPATVTSAENPLVSDGAAPRVPPPERKPEQPARIAVVPAKVRVQVPKGVEVASRIPEQRARLKLLPLNLTQERDPTLRPTNEILSLPAEDAGKRAEAAALWRSLNVTAQDVLVDEARLQSLHADLSAQRDLGAKTAQLLLDLSTRLEEMEAQKYANPLVYGLLVLLLACALMLAYSWTRVRGLGAGRSPWWGIVKGETESEEKGGRSFPTIDHASPAKQTEPLLPSQPASAPVPITPVAQRHPADLDIDLNLGESVFSTLGKTHTTALTSVPVERNLLHKQTPHDFSLSVSGGLRSINMQEMLDVRQQADFFMALGQYEEAIGVLVGSINDSGVSNPLVYLDLLKALHTLSRKTEYDHYREGFNVLFTGLVPEYTGFSQGGNTLDAYPEVVRKITALWPAPEALDYIEQCLVRSAEMDPGQGFDLNAYRDLLTLHGVASRLATESESAPVPFSFSTIKANFPHLSAPTVTSLGESVFKPDSTQTLSTLAMVHIALEEGAMGVDLDLSEAENNLIDFDADGLSTRQSI